MNIKFQVAEKAAKRIIPEGFEVETDVKRVKSVSLAESSSHPDQLTPKQEETIIPLIKQNIWRTEEAQYGLVIKSRRHERTQVETKPAKEIIIQDKTLSLEEEAMLAVIENAKGRQFADQRELKPIIASNAVPGIEDIHDEQSKFKHDVMLRPDECTEEGYERVPIEKFGAALLRGMGWEKGKPIGKNANGYSNF